MAKYNARIVSLDQETRATTSSGKMSSISLMITNIGDEVWYAYSKDHPVLIGYHYINEKGAVVEGIRTKLPYNISPGESVLLKCNFIIYSKLKELDIEWDLVREGDAWFKDYGSETIAKKVNLVKKTGDIQEINDEVAIICEGLSKKFKLYSRNSSKLTELVSAGIIKKHQDFWALKNISFKVNKGETYGIIGFNGSGKSTLLSILAQTKHHTQGVFRVNGRIAALLELGAGFT